MTKEFISSGDSEIDQVRMDVEQCATDMDNCAIRFAILATWVNLLQRRRFDLTGYTPKLDATKQGLDAQDPQALSDAVAAAFACLADIQAHARPVAAIVGGRSGTRPSTGKAGREWPVYGGDIHHTASTDEPGPATGQIAWKHAIGLAWYARPAVEGGRVYVASPGMRALLHCLDSATGECLWQTRRPPLPDQAGGPKLVPSSYATPCVAGTPVVLERTLIVNEIGAQGRAFSARNLTLIDKESGAILERVPAGQADYRIGCVAHAANESFVVFPDGTQRIQARPSQVIGQDRIVCKRVSDGETEWDFHVGPVFAEPLLDGDRVYTGTADGMFFCLNVSGASGAQYFGFSDLKRVAWDFKAGGAVNASAATTERHVYFGANDGCVYCLEKDSGTLVWKTETPDKEPRSFKLFSKPAVSNGRLYIGSAARRLYCLNAASGELLWSFETADWVRSCPAVVDGKVYAAAMDGTVSCLADSGGSPERLWETRVGTHPVYADLVPGNGRLFVSSSNLFLRCLDAENGSVLWEHFLMDRATVNGATYRSDEMGSGGWYQSKPTAADGKIFIGTPSRFVFALDHETGDEIWRFELGAAVSGAPAYANGRIFIGQQAGEEYFYCLDASTGQLVWKQAVGWVWSSANVCDGKALIPGVDGYVYCLDEDDGKIVWRHRTGSACHPEPPMEAGRVFFGSWDHYVYAFDIATGRHLWQHHTGGTPDSGAPIAYGGRLYVPMGGTRLCCLDVSDGRKLWEYPIENGCMNASPALWKDRIYISMSVRQAAIPIASRIRCLSTEDGREIWEHPGGGITGPAVADGKVYFASTSDPFFCCVDAEGNGDGTTDCLWRCEMGERVYESVPAIYAGRAFILNEDGYLYAFE